MSLLNLFRLRQTKPGLARPFRVPGYPVVPPLALALSLLCLGTIIYYNVVLSGVLFAGLGVYWLVGRTKSLF